MALTQQQKNALRLISLNPRKVIAILRGEPGFLTIHGNVENALLAEGLIAKVSLGQRERVIDGYKHTYDLTVWEITEKARKKYGSEIAPQYWTLADVRGLATGNKRHLREVHITLGQGDSMEDATSSKGKRIYGPAEVTIQFWPDGGVDQIVR